MSSNVQSPVTTILPSFISLYFTCTRLHSDHHSLHSISFYYSSKRQPSFIIAPTTDGAPDEMLILDNFNKIQFGGSRKIAVLGTFLFVSLYNDVFASSVLPYGLNCI